MANAGFSAATSYFGTLSNLVAKSSSQGASISLATATNAVGEVIAYDDFAEYDAPSTTYALTADLSLASLPALGSKVGSNIIVTSISISTSAGQPPSVTISGQEVPSTVASKRTYAIPAGTLYAKCKAQDPLGAFTAPDDTTTAYNSVTTTFSVDIAKQSVAGEIKALCTVNGKSEVAATIVCPSGTGTLTASTGYIYSSPDSADAQDESYLTHSATVTKWLTGTDVTPSGNSGGSDD